MPIEHNPEHIEGVEDTALYRKNVINRNTVRRGGMSGRAIQEFGKFMDAVRTWLVWKEESESSRFQPFLELLPEDSFDSRKHHHYYILYDLYGAYNEEEHERYDDVVRELQNKIKRWKNIDDTAY